VNKFPGENRVQDCAAFGGNDIARGMKIFPKSIIVSYNPQAASFHRESLREHVQGNALRLLKNHPVAFHAIAVVDSHEEADQAIANFTHLQRVAQGLAEPVLAAH